MPARTSHYSCDFCRARKLRCDRPLPCTSCVSRGKTCHFEPREIPRPNPRTPITPGSAGVTPQQQQLPVSMEAIETVSPITANPQKLRGSHPQTQQDLLVEIKTLKNLVQGLEKRVFQSQTHSPRNDKDSGIICHPFPVSKSTHSLSRIETGPTSILPSCLHQVSEVVTHLELLSMGKSSSAQLAYLNSQDPIPMYVDELVCKVECIRAIPKASVYTVQQGKPTRCIWLPRHDQARVLLGLFVTDFSYIYHVVHHPSLPAIVDDIYQQIDDHQPVKPAHLVLLLSIIATATHVWTQHVDADSGDLLFSSPTEAHAQTALWINAAQKVLSAGQNYPALALETIQGIIILSFLICNLEGVSLQYRSLISTGLLLSRELNLHRTDCNPSAGAVGSVHAEIGRRVWWYLAATDWMLAAKYGGPGEGVYQTNPLQMSVRKPLNINDADLSDNEINLEQPLSQPTDMSYFLQRIRLAEISRSIVDHNVIGASGSCGSGYYSHIVAMDFELDHFVNNLPTFFQLDSYNGSTEYDRSSSIFIQAYILNSLLHTQRCKLHLPYLTSAPKQNSAYAFSREICLKSARQIISAETQMLHSRHHFVQIRLRLAAILYGVFMASIVLLMDVCINRPSSVQHEIRHGNVAEALRIVERARSYSLAAAKLYESLMQVLAKHQARRLEIVSSPPAPLLMGAPYEHQTSTASIFEPVTTPAEALDRSGNAGDTSDYVPVLNSHLSQVPDDLTSLDDYQWDDLFSGIIIESSIGF